MPRRVEVISNTGRVMREGGRITEEGLPVFIAPPEALSLSAEGSTRKAPQETGDGLPMLLISFTQEALRSLPSGTITPQIICRSLNDQKKEFDAPNGSKYRLKAIFSAVSNNFYFDYNDGTASGSYNFGPVSLQEVLSNIPHSN